MKRLAALSIATTVTILNLTIDRGKAATFLLNNSNRSILSYETLLGQYQNLNFFRRNTQSQQGTIDNNKQNVDIKKNLDLQQEYLIFAGDNEGESKSKKIINNSLEAKTKGINNNHKSEISNISSSDDHYMAESPSISNNPTSIVLYDKNSPIVQSQKALDNLLKAKVDRSLSTTTTVSSSVNNPPQSENIIIANNLIVVENNDNFDRLPTPIVFLFSIIVYGGIIAIVIIQITLKTGTDLSTIAYWFRTLTKSQVKYKKTSLSQETTPNRYLQDLDIRKKAINREREEFKKITASLEKQTSQDNYLKNAIEIVKVALDNKQNFATLDRYEATYRSSKQQQFYSFVMETIADIVENQQFNFNSFQNQVEQKLQEILLQTRTEVGKQALKEYTKDLYQVTSTQLGLKLIYLLKQSQTSSHSILDTLFDLVNEASSVNLLDTNILKELVTVNWESLDKFGKVINLTGSQNIPETYIKILQYVSLYYKYKNAV